MRTWKYFYLFISEFATKPLQEYDDNLLWKCQLYFRILYRTQLRIFRYATAAAVCFDIIGRSVVFQNTLDTIYNLYIHNKHNKYCTENLLATYRTYGCSFCVFILCITLKVIIPLRYIGTCNTIDWNNRTVVT